MPRRPTTTTLTPAERRALVEKPFPIVRRLTTSYPHGGTLIQRDNNDLVAIRQKLERGESINQYSDLGTLTVMGGLYGDDTDV